MKKNKKFKNILLILSTFILINNNNSSDNSDNNKFIDDAINTGYNFLKKSPIKAGQKTAVINGLGIGLKALFNDTNNINNNKINTNINKINIEKPNTKKSKNNFKNINDNFIKNKNISDNKFINPLLMPFIPYLNKENNKLEKEEINQFLTSSFIPPYSNYNPNSDSSDSDDNFFSESN